MIQAVTSPSVIAWVHLLLALLTIIGGLYGLFQALTLLIQTIKQFPAIDNGALARKTSSLILQFAIWLVVGLIDIQLGVLFPN
jgi:hypothetical protein